MESFYGGRQGASFVIKKSFKYIDKQDPAYLADLAVLIEEKRAENPTQSDETLQNWAEWDLNDKIMYNNLFNTTYHDVWYNEYCIIDTTNKNNPNNGKIFRRVLPTEGNDNLPYEYVGTIIGPSSAAAMLKPQSGLIKFGDIRAELKNEWDGLGIAENTKPVIYDPSFSSESNQRLSQWPDEVDLEIYKAEIDKGLVQGLTEGALTKTLSLIDGKPEFKNELKEPSEDMPEPVVDNIKYNWFNVRKNTEGNDGVVESWCYIGFEVPATSFTVEALHSTPGTQPEVYENNISKTHPFWCDLHFEIPGGLRGVSVEEIFISEFNEEAYNNAINTTAEQIKAINADTLLSEEEKAERTQWIYENLKEYIDTLAKSVSAHTFDQLKYDSKSDTYLIEGEQKSFSTKSWFCKLRIMNFNPTPGATTPTTLENTVFYIGPVVEIKHVNLNTETGHLEILYHNKDDNAWDLRYPKQITFKTEKDTIEDSSGSKEIEYNTGYYDIDYSCGDDESGQFGFVRKVALTEDENGLNGSLTFTNSIKDQTQIYNFSYPKTLEFLTTDNLHDGRWKIDYFGAEDKSGQFGFVKSVGIAEDENGLKGTMTFNNTIEAETQEFDFSYPQDMSLNSDTGEWEIDYFGAEEKSGQLGYVKAAAIDSNKGTITFTNTIEHRTTVQDLIYVKDIDADAETGVLTATYSNSATEDFVQFIYPKTIQMDTEGNVTYINSASETIDMGQLVFIDDVVVDNAHQLLIAYTDNNQVETTANGTVELNGKTYINYGQTIGKLGIVSGPMPTGVVDKATIDNIVAWYNTTYAQGMIDGEVSGKLHVVTTEPVDGTDPISYFVMWDPDAKTWYQVSEIAGTPIGIPAQIGGVLETGGSESWSYSDSENSLADGVVRFVQLTENEEPLMVSFPWM